MARSRDEVEARMNPAVQNVSSVQTTLIMQVFVELRVYILNYWLVTEKKIVIIYLKIYCKKYTHISGNNYYYISLAFRN